MTAPKDPEKYKEYIRRLSESHKGKPSARKGKFASDETKRKLSESHKGKIHSGIFKKGHGFLCKNHGMKGKHHSEESRKKMSLTRTGRKFTVEWKNKLKEHRRHQVFPFKDSKPER